MNLKCVTLTGADDSTDPSDLIKLSREYPFVEWGILFSQNYDGTRRYPSKRWTTKLMALDLTGINFSAHIQGGYVRDMFEGKFSFLDDYPKFSKLCKRVQLNFHARKVPKTTVDFRSILRNQKKYPYQFILQNDGANNELISEFPDSNVVPLFDVSGGAGVLPSEWPVRLPSPYGDYCGYAGGLGPDNLEQELPRIAIAAESAKVWVDMETRIRSNNDLNFDIDKCRRVLEITKPLICSE
jgi:hypothetical protein